MFKSKLFWGGVLLCGVALLLRYPDSQRKSTARNNNNLQNRHTGTTRSIRGFRKTHGSDKRRSRQNRTRFYIYRFRGSNRH